MVVARRTLFLYLLFITFVGDICALMKKYILQSVVEAVIVALCVSGLIALAYGFFDKVLCATYIGHILLITAALWLMRRAVGWMCSKR